MKAIVSVALAAVMVAAACGGDSESGGASSTAGARSSEPAGGSFGIGVSAISETHNAQLEELFEEIGEDFESGPEIGLRKMADSLPQAAAIFNKYITELEALDVPDEFAADVEIHLEGLGEVVANFELQRAAAAAGSLVRIQELDDELASVRREFTAGLSADYLAYIDTQESDIAFTALFSDTTEAENQYFDGIRAAWAEFIRRNDQAQQSLTGTYSTAEDFLEAISAAGAGTAFAAVYDLAEELESPARFAEDHATFLAYLKEAVDLDRDIADAARTGDVTGFEVANHGLALAAPHAANEVSPTFAGVGFPGIPQTVLAATYEGADDFGLRLHGALRTLAIGFDPSGVFQFLPQTTDEQVMEAIPDITPEIIDQLEGVRAAINVPDPPTEQVADHKIIVVYLDDLIGLHREIISAAEVGDVGAMEAAMDGIKPLFDEAAAALSESITPAAGVYFGLE
jgi:hypothetical protein